MLLLPPLFPILVLPPGVVGCWAGLLFWCLLSKYNLLAKMSPDETTSAPANDHNPTLTHLRIHYLQSLPSSLSKTCNFNSNISVTITIKIIIKREIKVI